MHIKSVTLYSLPYIVSVASLVVAAHQVTPSLETALGLQSNVSSKTEIISGQVVNRSLKSDRLPIKKVVPEADDKVPPAKTAPTPKTEIDCKLPADMPGRCFADADAAAATTA